MATKFVVTRRIPDQAEEALRKAGDVWISPHDRPLETDELYAAIKGADAIIGFLHDRVDGDFLDAAGPQLQIYANVAVGFDNVDVPAATERGVLVTNTPGVLTDATADIAISLMLMATRRLGEGERVIRSQTPWNWHLFYMLGAGLQGKELGLIGFGAIGQAVARRARAFGMKIIYADPRRADEKVEAEYEATQYELDDLLARADVVSIHSVLNEHTRHLINAERLATMKPSAYLVNTARGPIIDEAALVEALKTGEIAGAGLDVFENEPAVDPGLLELENIVMIPHLGSATIETRTAMGVLAADNAINLTTGKPPITPVNPEVLEAG